MLEADFNKLNFSVLGTETYLEGNLKFDGDTIVNGRIQGTITILNQSKVIFERSSSMEGDLYAHDVEILGHFSGSINASGLLTIRSSAKVSGKIKADRLSIYPGAIVNIQS